jgi:tetratricopeptide (TPR) repeat protein
MALLLGCPAMARRAGRQRTERVRQAPPSGTAAPLLPTPSWRAWLAPASVFLVALLLRLLAARELGGLPLFRTPQLDSREYLDWARVIASGDLTLPAALPHGPGYAWFLAFLLRLFDGSLDAVRAVQSVVGALTCLFVFRIARRFFGASAGLAAGLIAAAYAPLIYIDVSLLGEGLLIASITAATWLVLDHDGHRLSLPRASLAGIALGAAILVRPTALVLLPILATVLWRRHERTAVALLVAGLMIPVAVVMTANLRANGAVVPVQAYGGLNFYQGNSPLRDGTPSARPGGAYNGLVNEPRQAGITAPGQQDRYFLHKTWSEIADAPLRFAVLLAKKVIWLLGSTEIRDSHSFYFFTPRSLVLQFGVRFGLLFPLALLGFVLALRRRTPVWLLAAAAIAFALTCIGLMVASRYRLPMVPFLVPYAGLGVIGCVEAIRAREPRQIALMTGMLLTGGVLSHLGVHRASLNLAEEWDLTGAALLRENDLPSARSAFENATKEDPKRGHAWAGMAAVDRANGQLPLAWSEAARGVAADPGDAFAQIQLAEIYAAENHLPQAVETYQKAMADDPELVSASVRLAELLVQDGRLPEAASRYEETLRAADQRTIVLSLEQRATLGLRLGEVYGALQRPAEGMRAVRAALALNPADGRAWVLLGMLAIDAHDLPAARDAIHNAEAYLPPDAQELVMVRQRLAQTR